MVKAQERACLLLQAALCLTAILPWDEASRFVKISVETIELSNLMKTLQPELMPVSSAAGSHERSRTLSSSLIVWGEWWVMFDTFDMILRLGWAPRDLVRPRVHRQGRLGEQLGPRPESRSLQQRSVRFRGRDRRSAETKLIFEESPILTLGVSPWLRLEGVTVPVGVGPSACAAGVWPLDVEPDARRWRARRSSVEGRRRCGAGVGVGPSPLPSQMTATINNGLTFGLTPMSFDFVAGPTTTRLGTPAPTTSTTSSTPSCTSLRCCPTLATGLCGTLRRQRNRGSRGRKIFIRGPNVALRRTRRR